MDTKVKEYNEKYYLKKALEFLKENGVEINEHSIKRTINYIKSKYNNEEYKKIKAKYIDSSFMRFVNDFENEVYCSANIQ